VWFFQHSAKPHSQEWLCYEVEENMRHAILGAGGVGGLIGVALAKSGESVTMALRPEALKDYPAELSLESPLGSFSVPVDRAASVAAPYDVLWITVKATQLERALRSITVDPEQLGAVVPLLNGMDHVSMLRARFGHDRVVPASIGVEAERAAPGKIIHRGMAVRLSRRSAKAGWRAQSKSSENLVSPVNSSPMR
jgi:2-dehydropantoate 2-reductase